MRVRENDRMSRIHTKSTITIERERDVWLFVQKRSKIDVSLWRILDWQSLRPRWGCGRTRGRSPGGSATSRSSHSTRSWRRWSWSRRSTATAPPRMPRTATATAPTPAAGEQRLGTGPVRTRFAPSRSPMSLTITSACHPEIEQWAMGTKFWKTRHFC